MSKDSRTGGMESGVKLYACKALVLGMVVIKLPAMSSSMGTGKAILVVSRLMATWVWRLRLFRSKRVSLTSITVSFISETSPVVNLAAGICSNVNP